MTHVPYTLDEDDPQAAPLGLIVLQVDETLEPEFNAYFSDRPYPIHVTRIPSGIEVTHESLSEMEQALPAAARLLPGARRYRVVGYGCTSASSVIGSERVAELVRQACDTDEVTNPLRAATACAADLGLSKFALLSPYIEEVNAPLRAAFAQNGITTDVFGTFAQAEEAKVARISVQSVIEAAVKLGADSSVDAVFFELYQPAHAGSNTRGPGGGSESRFCLVIKALRGICAVSTLLANWCV